MPLRTLEIVFPMTYISKFLQGVEGVGEGMPQDPSNKEHLPRSVVNRASKTTLGTPLCKKVILGDPGADSGGEGKSKRAEKYRTKKSKERQEEPLGTMSYQTSSKRSPPF